jgi:hypothetical protein
MIAATLRPTAAAEDSEKSQSHMLCLFFAYSSVATERGATNGVPGTSHKFMV